jgi:regulatory protein YycH of two-component signal transduction system YycFG
VCTDSLNIHLYFVQDDGEQIYRSSERFDLLNKLYQTLNKWKPAMEIGSKQDRIHRRNTHYVYAQYLESINAVDNAIQQ